MTTSSDCRTVPAWMLIAGFFAGISPARAQPFVVKTLESQIPPGDAALCQAAGWTPAGVQFVGIRRFHDGGFDRTPLIFPTPTSNALLMNNPPSDSTQGFISAVAFVPSLGVLQAGQYDRLIGSTQSTHAVVWNGTPNSAVDIHIASGTGLFPGVSGSISYAVSAAPIGFQAAGLLIASGRDQAAMWSGPTPQTAQVTRLHDDAIMFQSRAYGAYTFNGVAKQVGYSSDNLPGGLSTQPRARVWSGSAGSAIDLTPTGFLYGVINAGNGDGPTEILSGHVGMTISDQRPTIWTGLSGAFRLLDTLPGRPEGTVYYSSQKQGAGYLTNSGVLPPHAALWNLADGTVLDLHGFLPPEFQDPGGRSNAFFVDALGNVYGQASVSGASVGVPVIWTVPEPSSVTLSAVCALCCWAGRCLRRK